MLKIKDVRNKKDVACTKGDASEFIPSVGRLGL
jgi:hypothetical protein